MAMAAALADKARAEAVIAMLSSKPMVESAAIQG